MKKKRCGVKDVGDGDIVGGNDDSVITTRHKRYAIQGSRWRNRNITYRVTKYPTTKRLSKKEVDLTIKKAFNVWTKVTI